MKLVKEEPMKGVAIIALVGGNMTLESIWCLINRSERLKHGHSEGFTKCYVLPQEISHFRFLVNI